MSLVIVVTRPPVTENPTGEAAPSTCDAALSETRRVIARPGPIVSRARTNRESGFTERSLHLKRRLHAALRNSSTPTPPRRGVVYASSSVLRPGKHTGGLPSS